MARTDLPSFLLCSAVTGCVVLFFAFTVVKELNFYLFSRGLIQARSKIAIHYFDVVEYMGSPPAGSVRGGEWGAEIIFRWGTTLAAVLLTIWYRNVRNRSMMTSMEMRELNSDAELAQPLIRNSRSRYFRVAAKRVLSYQLPPRRFFRWLCADFSVMDALVVLAWLGLNVAYILPAALRGIPTLHYPGQTRLQYSQDAMQLVCQCFGNATTLNVMLLFFPISRSSFLHWWLGTDFPALIRYHRWLGHGTFVILIIHGPGHLCVFISQHVMKIRLVWAPEGVNRICGVIAFSFLLLMYLTSTSYIRRRYFEVFYRMHVVGFVGFIVFAHMHWKDLWVTVLPGLLLYMLDVTFRCMQMMHTVHIQRFAISPDRSVATLHFDYAELQDKAINPDQIMFLHIPSISRVQWHPFTVAAEPVPDGRGSATAQAHIKSYGKWTRGMIQQLLAKGGLTARVDGPYGGHGHPSWVDHNVLAIFAGGIGVTPVLAMLRDIIARRAHHATTGSYGTEGAPPERVYFVFAARTQAELDLVAPTLAAALEEGDWLDVQLYFTGGDVAKAQAALAITDMHDFTNTKLPPAADGPAPRNTRIQGQHFGDWHLAAAYIISMGGGLAGGVLAYGYAAHRDQHGHLVDHWAVGALSLVLTAVGAMALPALIIFPGHIWRYAGWSEAATKYEVPAVDSANPALAPMMEEPEEPVVSLENTTVSLSAKVQKHHAGITLLGGRPNIAGVIRGITARHQDELEVCVAAAGPDALVDVVGAACHAHNDAVGWRGRPYLDFHKQAFSL